MVACFGSDVARLITLSRIAEKTGLYMALYGRSLRNMVSAARLTGHWTNGASVAEGRHLAYLWDQAIQVIEADDVDFPIHASGHPCLDELTQMYQWVKPDIAIPVQGTLPHLNAIAAVARKVGIENQMLGGNGDPYILAPKPGLKRKVAQVGRVDHDRN